MEIYNMNFFTVKLFLAALIAAASALPGQENGTGKEQGYGKTTEDSKSSKFSVSDLQKGLHDFQYLAKIFNHKESSQLLQNLSEKEKPADKLDPLIAFFYEIAVVVKNVCNQWIPGSGELYTYGLLFVCRYSLCTDGRLTPQIKRKGWPRAQLCYESYDIAWDWPVYKGNYTYDDLKSFYFPNATFDEQMVTYFQDGSQFQSGTAKIIYDSFKNLSTVINKQPDDWATSDVINTWVTTGLMFTAFASSYDQQMGQIAVDGYFSYSLKIFTRVGAHIQNHYDRVHNVIGQCDRNDFNGAINFAPVIIEKNNQRNNGGSTIANYQGNDDYNLDYITDIDSSSYYYQNKNSNRKSCDNKGESVARFLNWVTAATGASPASFHIAGHSLGGQQAGIVGRNLVSPATYITALDPALPGWNSNTNSFRVDDGSYTEVIQTNSGTRIPWFRWTSTLMGAQKYRAAPLRPVPIRGKLVSSTWKPTPFLAGRKRDKQ